MNNKHLKFENPVRLEELRPLETLNRIGLKEDHVLADIGAGSGVFTIPAAKITENKVYALDINDQMLELIQEKKTREGLTNIELIKVDGSRFDLPDDSCDIVLLVTVLHEIKDTTSFIREIKRVMKKDGRIAIIEFHKKETPMGPPVAHRLGKMEVAEVCIKLDLNPIEQFDLGENYYCSIYI